MALEKVSQTNPDPSALPSILLKVSNGDLKALQDVKDKWGFKDEASALRFALAVIAQSEEHLVYIATKDGGKVPLTPGDNYLEKKEPIKPD